MGKSSFEEGPSSSDSRRREDRKRKHERRPRSSSSHRYSDDSNGRRTGSAQSVDSPRAQEVRPGSLLEALIESKEKGDSSHHSKKSKKRKRKESSGEKIAKKEEIIEEDGTKPRFEPAAVAGAASEELDLTLKKEDLGEDYLTDEEEEAEERRSRLESQRIKKADKRTIEYEGEMRWNHEEELARFEEEVRGDIRRKKEGQSSVPTVHTPSLHNACRCARGPGEGRDSGSSSASEGGGDSEDSDEDTVKKDQREQRKRASIKKRNKRRKAKQSEAAVALVKQEVDWRRHHPSALSSEIVFNVRDMLNESPACRCSASRKEVGVRHNHYLGETKLESTVESCSISSLHHYVLSVRPSPSEQLKRKNEITIDEEGSPFVFDGFSLLSHRALPSILPQEPQHKWTDEYHFNLEEDEKLSEQMIGSVRALDSLFSYITDDILELFDLRKWPEEVERKRRSRVSRGLSISREEEEIEDGCPIFHLMPRFVREKDDGSRELAPVSAVFEYIRKAYARPFCPRDESAKIHMDHRLFDEFADAEKDGLVIDAARRPSSLRVDMVCRREYLRKDGGGDGLPVITHQAWRPTPFLLAARPDYQQACNALAEMKAELHASTHPDKKKGEKRKKTEEEKEEGEEEDSEEEAENGKRLTPEEERTLRARISSAEAKLVKLKNECMARRETPISLSSKQFRRTGFKADLAQHTILLVMMMNHVRYHWAIEKLEERIGYKFEDRTLIELALSHPSYCANYGTNPDHARNAINLCGVRQSEQKSRQHLEGPKLQTEILELKRGRNRKKGLDRLVELMEGMPGGKKLQINPSTINERLEFLGDSVVEMIVTVHLFFLLPNHDEGALATFRSALVQNKNLASLAEEIYLDKLMLMSHGVELLHEPEYRHATANSFEAFMAAVYLDSGKNMDHCERIYGDAMYGKDPEMLHIWNNLKEHELKDEYPVSDRCLIPKVEVLQKLVEFEDSIGLKFAHIRLLAKAFTRNCASVNNLTKGDHQTLELLGDTILQMATTEFLYRRFPLLHEGHLSLLRTCLVSNKTQSVICDDLDMCKYVVDFSPRQKKVFRMKDKADLVEALLGAIYVDRGWEYCRSFTRVCFFPRMKFFIDSHAWSDPKSALQQLCLALPRTPGVSGRLMPEYRVVAEHGPTNTREYRVACVFRGKKISEGLASTVHNAQMKAAQEGMQNLPKFFPEEWAKHEQKLIRQRSGREPLGEKKGEERAGNEREEQSSPYSPYSPEDGGPSTSTHYPTPFLPYPTQYPPFMSHLPSYHQAAPPVFSLPPPNGKPMDLMSLDLHSLMMMPSAPVPLPPPHCVAPPSAQPPCTLETTRSNKKKKRDRKRKREENAENGDGPAPPPPPPQSASISSRRPSTPLPPPPGSCPVRRPPGAGTLPPPPPSDDLPPLPSDSVPVPSQPGWMPPVSARIGHDRPRSSHQRPAHSNGRPRSIPYQNGGGHSHQRPRPHLLPSAPTQMPMQTQTLKPKSLLDLSFNDMWGGH